MLDTRNKYNRYKTFIETGCIMCGETMIIPKALKDSIKCCSEYCSQRRLTLLRLKGKYVLCDMCNKPKWIMPKEYKKNKHFCSRKCDNMYRKLVEPLGQTDRETTGRKKYYGENWRRQRRKARERDNYTCQMCGITEDEYGKELSVHHIIPFVMFDNYLEANKEENLISVCEPCHRKIHSGENHPYKFDKSKIKNDKDVKNGGVLNKQKEDAIKIVELLQNTDMTLKEISKIVGCSCTRVTRIYHGERWTELYDVPPYITNPRKKAKNNVG